MARWPLTGRSLDAPRACVCSSGGALLQSHHATHTPLLQARGVRQAVLLTGGVYFLSPLLHTLTRNISSDSVVALAAALLALHLYLYDYK